MKMADYMVDEYQIIVNTDSSQRETTQHGTPDFPLTVYRDSLRRSILGYINWHWHPELQYVYITEGQVKYTVNNSVMIMNPGDALLINSGRLHMAETVGNTNGTYVSLMFHPNLLSMFTGSVYDRSYVRPYLENEGIPYLLLHGDQPEDRDLIERFMKAIILYEAQGDKYEIDVLTALWYAWKAVLNMPAAPIATYSSPLASAITEYVSKHFNESLTLQMIADAVHFSEAECCRQFKRITGETIFTFLKKERIEYSLNLLRNSSLSVSEIAYASGFSTASYFINTFRSMTGITPKQYRKHLSS